MKRALSIKLLVFVGLSLLAALALHWQADIAHDFIPIFHAPAGAYTSSEYSDQYEKWIAVSEPSRQRWLALQGTSDLLTMVAVLAISSYFSLTWIRFFTAIVCIVSWLALYLSDVYSVDSGMRWTQIIFSDRYALVTRFEPVVFLAFLLPAICSGLLLYDAKRSQMAVLCLVVLLCILNIDLLLQFGGREDRSGCEGCIGSIWLQYAMDILMITIALAYRLFQYRFKKL